MKKLNNPNQAGVGHIALVLVVLVFGAIGFIGYKLYAHPLKPTSGSTAVTQTPAANTAVAPQIKTATDLDKATNVLDQNDPTSTSASDSAYLDAQTAAIE